MVFFTFVGWERFLQECLLQPDFYINANFIKTIYHIKHSTSFEVDFNFQFNKPFEF